ncbi:16S rRNA (guanine(527)-N(7))-methyltransferase RsmG [Chelatococcus reniformis]|uniref:Ribosomal RNA small subunit methyltransferase G n=1 Tax=Chelatococcus reniformis TaxID=1494448 RepID=A0A916X8G9_9HYPH|nr:16S rRNA (guanine(527)-N(7))-methyltransferase RsmG [Chelatococcus reniformis]GGC51581.1 hypothetical protein GCM10010994_08370 [Chelatococcus reniformis]
MKRDRSGADPFGDRERALALRPVSRETEERFALLESELRRWQAVKNLVGPDTLNRVWTRHIIDSAQLLDIVPGARHWLDLGSGGGFPGLVLGILLADSGGHIHLVESNGRKCAFLRHAARITGASATIHEARIEDCVIRFAGQTDVVTARAVAPLDVLLGWTKDLLRTGTVALFPKGQDVESELTQATRSWKIDATLVQSLTDSAGRIVFVRGLEGS